MLIAETPINMEWRKSLRSFANSRSSRYLVITLAAFAGFQALILVADVDVGGGAGGLREADAWRRGHRRLVSQTGGSANEVRGETIFGF